MDWLTAEFLIGAMALFTSVAKIWSDRKAKRKTDVYELGQAAWLVMVGAQSVLPDKGAAIAKWRRIASDLSSAWGLRISPKAWAKLEEFANQRYELETRTYWDTTMAALLESAVGIEKWANGIAPMRLRLPKVRAHTEPALVPVEDDDDGTKD